MQAKQPPKPIVLASTSPYRRTLLGRLRLEFEVTSPEVDETPRVGESAHDLVRRLSEAKTRAAADRHRDAVIIGSDQVAILGGAIIGKPGTRDNALRQLERASGARVRFLTGVCVLDSGCGELEIDVVPFDVLFRRLTARQIDNYVDREQPLNCAGSFKSEGLGIALFERMEGTDPTALMGLPLMRLVRMLERRGIDIL